MVNGKLFHLPSLSFPKRRNFIGPHIWVLLSVDAFKPGPFGSHRVSGNHLLRCSWWIILFSPVKWLSSDWWYFPSYMGYGMSSQPHWRTTFIFFRGVGKNHQPAISIYTSFSDAPEIMMNPHLTPSFWRFPFWVTRSWKINRKQWPVSCKLSF